MCKTIKAFELIGQLCCACWNEACHHHEQSDRCRLHQMSEARRRNRCSSVPDRSLQLKRLCPLHRHLNMNSEQTRMASYHWLWRGQEEYLDWKQHDKHIA